MKHMYILILSSFLLFASAVKKKYKEINEARLYCGNLYKHVDGDLQASWEYVSCVYVQTGVIKSDGTVNTIKYFKSFDVKMRPEYKKDWEECLAGTIIKVKEIAETLKKCYDEGKKI